MGDTGRTGTIQVNILHDLDQEQLRTYLLCTFTAARHDHEKHKMLLIPWTGGTLHDNHASQKKKKKKWDTTGARCRASIAVYS